MEPLSTREEDELTVRPAGMDVPGPKVTEAGEVPDKKICEAWFSKYCCWMEGCQDGYVPELSPCRYGVDASTAI